PAAVHRLRLEQRADLAHRKGEIAERLAVDDDRALVRVVKPEDAAHRGGLACPVRPQEAGDLARLDAERQVIDGDLVAVPLREPPYLNHGNRPSPGTFSRSRTAGEESRFPTVFILPASRLPPRRPR